MSIRCGHCRERHESVGEVRACGGTLAPRQAQSGLPEGREPEVLGINRPRSSGGQMAAEGVYRLDGKIYRVVDKAGRRHAEQYVNGAYCYAKGWVYRLRPEHRLTLEEAKAWGLENVRCIRCGVELTKKESREAGIGPVCRTKV